MYKQASIEAREELDVQRDGMDVASRNERHEPDSCNPLIVTRLDALHTVAMDPWVDFKCQHFEPRASSEPIGE